MTGRIAFILVICSLIYRQAAAQSFFEHTPSSDVWVKAQMRKMNLKQKIAQLMVLRQSEIKDNHVLFYQKELKKYIKKYKIGSICLFQGNPYEQALNINELQKRSKIPLLVCIDGETGLGMRMTDSVLKFPDQLTLGAMRDTALVYEIGRAMALQCRRMGIQVNYAPVVDINNNPLNPIIGYRSFGENKYTVAQYGALIMRGMQDENVMACAKHFPGHGDVSVDSHLDLPVIRKSMAALDTLELYPFRYLIDQGVASMMVAHLSVSAIDSTPHLPTSLSPKAVKGLLKNDYHFQGITFTDALEMKGVSKFYPAGEASAQSLIAGNDMLCLPGDIKGSIKKVKKAIKKGEITKSAIDEKVEKVLLAKYNLGLSRLSEIPTAGITSDLNKDVLNLREKVAEKSLTIVKLADTALLLPLSASRVAYVGVGADSSTVFGNFLQKKYQASSFYINYKDSSSKADSLFAAIRGNYDLVIVGLHNFSKRPANNFGIPSFVYQFIHTLSDGQKTALFSFGNPYVLKNFDRIPNVFEAYEDDSVFQTTAAMALSGNRKIEGVLPVTVTASMPAGAGITWESSDVASPERLGFSSKALEKIDSIANDGVKKKHIPAVPF